MNLTAAPAGASLSITPVSDQRAALEAPRLRPVARSLLAWRRDLTVNYQLYLLVLLPVVYIFVFMYIPMYGTQIAFRNFLAVKGIWGSEWVGFKYFLKFFDSPYFVRVVRNTLEISMYTLIAGFPFPILLAVALNCSLNRRFKKSVQMVTYAPYFISTVVMVGMLIQFLSPRIGFVNDIIAAIGFERVMFLSEPALFSSVYVGPGSGSSPAGTRSSTWRRCPRWTRSCTRRRSSTAPTACGVSCTSTSPASCPPSWCC